MLHLDQKPWCPVVAWMFWKDLNNVSRSVWDLLIGVIMEKLRNTLCFFSLLENYVLSSIPLFSVTSYYVVYLTADHLGLTFLHHLIVLNPLISQIFLLTDLGREAWWAQTPRWQEALWAQPIVGQETSMTAWMATELFLRGQQIKAILWSTTLLKEKCNCSSIWDGQEGIYFFESMWVNLLWLIVFQGDMCLNDDLIWIHTQLIFEFSIWGSSKTELWELNRESHQLSTVLLQASSRWD